MEEFLQRLELAGTIKDTYHWLNVTVSANMPGISMLGSVSINGVITEFTQRILDYHEYLRWQPVLNYMNKFAKKNI